MAAGAQFTLHFEHCTYMVQVSLEGKPVPPQLKNCIKTKDKILLRDVSASVSSGHVLAILGPSGAGKTTLLNMLTLQRKGGQPFGSVMLNGTPMDGVLYREHCAYVQQQDALWASLTTREHLSYAFALCRPDVFGAARVAGIDSLLEELSLKGKPEHTKAGNQFMGGLSSGLKRRLSIAIALAKKPSLLFLDEPTTGVDSASAAKIMGFLKQIAADKNLAIACTIHQPPASVFKGFDDNVVLASGRIAYFGPAAEMGEYFTALGRPPPAGVNLAEFVLDLVNKDFTAAAQVDELLNAWSRSERAQTVIAAGASTPKGLPQAPSAGGFCSQVCTGCSRRLEGPPARPSRSALPLGPPARPSRSALPLSPPARPSRSALPLSPPARPSRSALPLGPPACALRSAPERGDGLRARACRPSSQALTSDDL